MAIALLGYFTTMVGALAGLMLILNMFFTLAPTERTRAEPHPRPAIAQLAEPAEKVGQWDRSPAPRPAEVADSTSAVAAKSVMDQHVATAARAAAEKSKRLKIARVRKQKMLAQQREKEENTTAALGYAQEPSYSPPFNPFGARF
jgi:hypothetical protein